jgi:hypothetical protein
MFRVGLYARVSTHDQQTLSLQMYDKIIATVPYSFDERRTTRTLRGQGLDFQGKPVYYSVIYERGSRLRDCQKIIGIESENISPYEGLTPVQSYGRMLAYNVRNQIPNPRRREK